MKDVLGRRYLNPGCLSGSPWKPRHAEAEARPRELPPSHGCRFLPSSGTLHSLCFSNSVPWTPWTSSFKAVPIFRGDSSELEPGVALLGLVCGMG